MADSSGIPQATVEPQKRARISVVWVIPILAAVVAIGIAVQRIINEGPTITIVFKASEGLEAGKTFIKYKDVNIGQVTKVQLAADYSRVEVTAKIDKSAAGLMVEDAKFWIVEPRITLSGISGLGTLLSGNYIGFGVGKSDKPQRTFTALEVAPVITGGQPGREFTLKADDLGSLGVGSPIYYRRLQVGQVIAYDLARDGGAMEIKIFVDSPYDRYVNPGTRFWNASGIDVSFGAGGLDVRTQSLVTLLAGGLAFDTPPFAPKADPAAAHTVFTLYADRTTAMKQPDAVAVHYVLYFNESLRGLSVGAPVTLFGLVMGEVTALGLDLDQKSSRVRGRVEVAWFPERVIAQLGQREAGAGRSMEEDTQRRRAFTQNLVEQRGLRAQLRSGNLLTGQLFVALDFFPDAPKVKIDWSRNPAEFPVVASTVTDLEAKISGIVAKLDKLPYEEIGASLTKVLATLDATLRDTRQAVNRLDAETLPQLKPTLDELRAAIATADRVLKSTDATLVGKDAPTQQELRDTLQEVTRAARSLRILTDYLERHPESLIRGKAEDRP